MLKSLKTPGYSVEVDQITTVVASTNETSEKVVDIAALMSMGDVDSGEKFLKSAQLVTLL